MSFQRKKIRATKIIYNLFRIPIFLIISQFLEKKYYRVTIHIFKRVDIFDNFNVSVLYVPRKIAWRVAFDNRVIG